jgi:hypothetical protein
MMLPVADDTRNIVVDIGTEFLQGESQFLETSWVGRLTSRSSSIAPSTSNIGSVSVSSHETHCHATETI